MARRRARNPSAADTRPRTLEHLLDGPLQDVIAEVESVRRRVLRVMLGWTLAFVPAGGAGVWWLVQRDAADWMVVGAAVLALGVPLGVAGHHFQRYRADFKQRLVRPLFAAFHPGLVYAPDEAIDAAEFEAAGLFRELPVSRYGGEDFARGRIGATDIRFCEVEADHVERDSGGREHTERIFRGLFFVADFHKHFRGRTYVLPDRAQRLLGGVGQSLQGLSSTYGQLVKLEDPAFEKLFVVYASDQVEARYILSTALMARITDFRTRSGHALRLGFVDSRLYAAIDVRRNLFEPRLFRSIDDPPCTASSGTTCSSSPASSRIST
jgi:hypothetical protein